MAKIRLNPLSSTEKDFPHDSNETLQTLFERFFESLPVQDEELKDYYEILLDGKSIPREMWSYVKPQECTVLIAITPKGGSGRNILRTTIVLAAVITASVLTQGLALGPLGGALLTAGTAIGATLLVNALIPPEIPALGGLGELGTGYNFNESQMYTIGNQSNQTKKFSNVPKVYGRHKMFPTIAATPYTQLETDEQGNLAQYFYCIYDFGLGPANIYGIQIGATAFEEYTDANYRLVDPNKPAVDEGEWDENTFKTFAYYRGDVVQESVGVTIDGNEQDIGSVPSEYQIIRNADDSGNGDGQEVYVTLVAGQGLTTFGTDGGRANRNIDVRIEFAEVGSSTWQSFNDPTVVESWTGTGDVTRVENRRINFLVNSKGIFDRYYSGWDTPSVRRLTYDEIYQRASDMSSLPNSKEDVDGTDQFFYDTYYLRQGSTTFQATTDLNIGDTISNGGERLGKIASKTTITGGYSYTLDTPLATSVFAFEEYTNLIGSLVYTRSFTDGRGAPTSSTAFVQELSTAGVFTLTGNSSNPVYFQLKFQPKTTSQIKLRVTRERSYGGYSYTIRESLQWFSITTRFDRDPIVTTKRHVFAELRVKATDQLNGTIRNLSGIVHSVLPVYDDVLDVWNLAETRNPAWIFSDLLTGEINKNAVLSTRLDTDSLVEWATLCDAIPDSFPTGPQYEQPRFSCDLVLDYKATLSKTLNKICSSAQAGFNIINGKYGVLIDKEKTVPVQVFTPRNTNTFSSTRNYAELPDAIKIRYVDGTSDWSIREAIVYNDGFTAANAVKFDELDAFACTNDEQAFRYGRYMLFQAILRKEVIQLSVDFENLVCTRGDYVLLQHDVMKVGGSPARVKTVVGNRITIDDSFSDGGGSYGYTFRGVSGISTNTLTIIDPDTADLDGDIPAVGDLIVWGEVDQITFDAVVKAITPGPDLTATITLIERANEIHDAESQAALPTYDPELSTADEDFDPPGEVPDLVAAPQIDCQGSSYLYTLEIAWSAPTESAVEVYEIYVNSGAGFELVDYVSSLSYSYVVPEADLGLEHSIKVIGVAATGNKLTLGDVTAVTATPVSKTTAPSDVDALYINVTSETLLLEWTLVDDCDISYYLVRYSPNTASTWASSIPIFKADKNTNNIQIQARTGSYYVKAIDFNGNESTNAALAKTAIPELVNLNVIEETNDFPTLLGNKDRVEKLSASLTLQEEIAGTPPQYYSEGFYYYQNVLSLGDIYTIRLQSLIEAEGYSADDLMSNWVLLSDVAQMATSTVSDWDVETQYRATDDYITIDTWDPMSDVLQMSAGLEEVWTDWAKFTIGDFTGRYFQFRLRLISNKPSITPRVFDGVIKADVPDRIESYDNIVVPITGYVVTYSPAFLGPSPSPAVQISQDNASQGDYYIITDKDLEGFTVTFYDKTDTAVQRQADFFVKGYGRKVASIP